MSLHWIDDVRRNHAIEHATIAVLARRHDLVGQLGGRAVLNGFYVYGPTTQDAVEEAAREAVTRLRNGEERLAVSPFCGTNFLLAGATSTLVSAITLGTRNRLGRLPQAMGLASLALIASFRFGGEIQRRWTTKPQIGSVEIERVEQRRPGRHAVHRVFTSAPPGEN